MVYGIMKILHIAAFAALFMGLGGLVFHALSGGTKETNEKRAWGVATHGAALLVLFITGFGLLGVLKMSAFPFALWVWLKLVLFLVMGGLLALVQRKHDLAKVWWFTLPVLAAIIAGIAIFKPGVSS